MSLTYEYKTSIRAHPHTEVQCACVHVFSGSSLLNFEWRSLNRLEASDFQSHTSTFNTAINGVINGGCQATNHCKGTIICRHKCKTSTEKQQELQNASMDVNWWLWSLHFNLNYTRGSPPCVSGWPKTVCRINHSLPKINESAEGTKERTFN